MFYRASKFYFQFSKALKNKCFVCRNQSLIGNISNSAKHKGVPIRSGPPKKLVTPSRIGGFSFSLIGLKSLQQYKVICEENYNNEAPIVKVKNISNWKKLAYLIYLDIWCWIGALVTAIFVAYINIQLPLCLGDLANIIANMAKESSRTLMEELNLPVGKLIVLYLAQAFGTFVYISLLSRAGENLAEKLKCDLYNAIIRQDIAFFDTRRTGELLDCLFSDVQEFKSSFKQCVSQGVKNVLQICGCVLSLFKISPAMTCTVLTIVPAIIVAGSIFGMLLRKISQAAQIESVKTFTMSEEVLSNIRTVRSFSSEALECEKFRDQLQRTSYMNSVLGYGIGFFQAGTNLFLNGLVLGTLYIGSRYVVSDNLSPGRLMSFLVTAQIIQKSFAQLSLIFGHVIKGKQAFQRVCYFTNLKPTIPTSGGIKIPFHSLIPTIEFKDVTFAYPTRPKQDILQNLNLTLPAGKTVAVVGASGNGKSTIALLLERFYDVSSGSITLNNIDIRKLDPHWLRGTVIGIINQEPVLFATTVKENIRYGKPNATDEEVYEAARQANADDFIRKFPEGYDTLVGERGVSVSGGQKQRIAIARALIKKPSILILDEATSALDPDSEKVVQETLEKVCQGRTVLVIAHRLSTVRNADIIAVLNKGIILEMGSHDQLMKQKGVYYGMMSQQRTFPSRFFSSG